MPLGLGLITGLGHNVAAAGGGGGGGGSSIATIAGADLLMEVTGTSLTGSNGDDIASWNDESANNNDLTGSAGAGTKPTLAVAGLNSRNVANFSAGSAQNFLLTSGIKTALAAISGSTGATLVAIRKAAATGSNGPLFADFGTDALGDAMPFSNDLWYTDALSTTRHDAIPIPVNTGWHIMVIRSKNGRWTVDVDGVNYLDAATNTYAFNSGGSPTIGYGGGGAFGGQVAQIDIIGRFVSDVDLAAIFASSDKTAWGL
jgi:hypothetical protein